MRPDTAIPDVWLRSCSARGRYDSSVCSGLPKSPPLRDGTVTTQELDRLERSGQRWGRQKQRHDVFGVGVEDGPVTADGAASYSQTRAIAAFCDQRGPRRDLHGFPCDQRGPPWKLGVSSRLDAIFDPSRIQN